MDKKKKPMVYIAGPYTKGDVAVNVKNALKTATMLLGNGFIPYVPHLTHFWHLVFPLAYDKWLEYDNEFLRLCDFLLRIPGESNGADKEEDFAKSLNIPVCYNLTELLDITQE